MPHLKDILLESYKVHKLRRLLTTNGHRKIDLTPQEWKVWGQEKVLVPGRTYNSTCINFCQAYKLNHFNTFKTLSHYLCLTSVRLQLKMQRVGNPTLFSHNKILPLKMYIQQTRSQSSRYIQALKSCQDFFYLGLEILNHRKLLKVTEGLT